MEEIYTEYTGMNEYDHLWFQTPAEKFKPKLPRDGAGEAAVSNSSGRNLHSARNSIFVGYEYLKFIFLPLKFR